MGLGSLGGGMAEGALDQLKTQQNQAFQLKLQSAQIEQAAQARMAEKAQEITAATNTAQAAYQRGLVPEGTAASLLNATGVDTSGMNQADLGGAGQLLKAVRNPALLNAAGPKTANFDPQTGLTTSWDLHNQLNGVKSVIQNELLPEQTKLYNTNMQYLNVLNQTHRAFQERLQQGGFGSEGISGGIASLFPDRLAPATAKLTRLANELGPLAAETEGGVTGGRYSQGMGKILGKSGVDTNMVAGEENDLYKDAMLRAYQRFSLQGKINTAPDGQPLNGVVVPPILENMFGTLIPHFDTGHPIKFAGYSVKDNTLLDAQGNPLGKISKGDVPSKPALNHRTMQRVISTAAQKGSQSVDPFQGIDWSK